MSNPFSHKTPRESGYPVRVPAVYEALHDRATRRTPPHRIVGARPPPGGGSPT